MEKKLALFKGEHDFTSFSKADGREPVRNIIDISVREEGGFTLFSIKAKSFLWNMVRRIIWTALEMEAKRMNEQSVRTALIGKGDLLTRPMPPDYLVLVDVDYGLHFKRASLAGELDVLDEKAGRALGRSIFFGGVSHLVGSIDPKQ